MAESVEGKKQLSREELLKFIKRQKVQLKKGDDAKASIADFLYGGAGETNVDWNMVVDGVKALTRSVASNGPAEDSSLSEISWRDKELKSRGDRLLEMSLEIDELTRQNAEQQSALVTVGEGHLKAKSQIAADNAKLVAELEDLRGVVTAASARTSELENLLSATRTAEALLHSEKTAGLESQVKSLEESCACLKTDLAAAAARCEKSEALARELETRARASTATLTEELTTAKADFAGREAAGEAALHKAVEEQALAVTHAKKLELKLSSTETHVTELVASKVRLEESNKQVCEMRQELGDAATAPEKEARKHAASNDHDSAETSPPFCTAVCDETVSLEGMSSAEGGALVCEKLRLFASKYGSLRLLDCVRPQGASCSDELSIDVFKAALAKLGVQGASTEVVKAAIEHTGFISKGNVSTYEAFVAALTAFPPSVSNDESNAANEKNAMQTALSVAQEETATIAAKMKKLQDSFEESVLESERLLEVAAEKRTDLQTSLTAAKMQEQETRVATAQKARELEERLGAALSELANARESESSAATEVAAMEASRKERKDLCAEVERVKATLAASEAAIEKLTSDLDIARAEAKGAEIELESSREEIACFRSTLRETESTEEKRKAELEEERKVLFVEAGDSRVRLSDLEAAISAANLREKEIHESMGELTEALNEARARERAAEANARTDGEAKEAALDEVRKALEKSEQKISEERLSKEEAKKTVDELSVRERKLKSLLAKQKALLKSREEETADLRSEAKAGGDSKRSAMELSAELKARGEALRRATDEVDTLKRSLSAATAGCSKAEGLLEATSASLKESQVAASEATKRSSFSEHNAQELRTQFDEYKRRAASVLARGASLLPDVPSSPTPLPNSDWEGELMAYKARTSEALRQANESVAKFRALSLVNAEEVAAMKEQCVALEIRAARTDAEAANFRSECVAAKTDAASAMRSSEDVKMALDRVSRDLGIVTARASAAEALVRSGRERAEEDSATISTSACEVTKLKTELAKATRQGNILSNMSLDTRVDDVGSESGKAFEAAALDLSPSVDARAPKTVSPGRSSPPSESKEDTAPPTKATSERTEGTMPTDTAQRRAIVDLQTELAETTLSLGDANEKVQWESLSWKTTQFGIL